MVDLSREVVMSRIFGAVMAAILLLTGCSSSVAGEVSASPTVGDISLIKVGASDTLAPAITWPSSLEFMRNQSSVVWPGEGAVLQDGQPLLLDMYVQSLDTGEVLRNTYDGLPQSYLLASELLGDDLYRALLKARVGTRILSVAPSQKEFQGESAIVIVIDVLPDAAVGEDTPTRDDLPRVTSEANGQPTIVLNENQELPTVLTTAALIRGPGEQIKPGSFIVAQFKAVYTTDGTKDGKSWKAGDVRQSTWPAEQAPFEGQVGKGKLLRGWDEGLIDQTAGSRVMLVVPEEWGYPGEGTIIYVIDILDVWNKAE